MRLFSTGLLAIICSLTIVSASAGACGKVKVGEKSFLLSFGNDAPDSLVDQAIENAEKNGARICHRFNLVKGFSAIGPADLQMKMESFTTQEELKQYPMNLEEEKMVNIQG